VAGSVPAEFQPRLSSRISAQINGPSALRTDPEMRSSVLVVPSNIEDRGSHVAVHPYIDASEPTHPSRLQFFVRLVRYRVQNHFEKEKLVIGACYFGGFGSSLNSAGDVSGRSSCEDNHKL
jgi:hypothetical protein